MSEGMLASECGWAKRLRSLLLLWYSALRLVASVAADQEIRKMTSLSWPTTRCVVKMGLLKTRQRIGHWSLCTMMEISWLQQKTDRPSLLYLSQSENLQSLPMSHHFGYAKAYAMLTRVEFFLTRSTLRKLLCEVLTRPYASEGFAYVKRVMTRPLLKM